MDFLRSPTISNALNRQFNGTTISALHLNTDNELLIINDKTPKQSKLITKNSIRNKAIKKSWKEKSNRKCHELIDDIVDIIDDIKQTENNNAIQLHHIERVKTISTHHCDCECTQMSHNKISIVNNSDPTIVSSNDITNNNSNDTTNHHHWRCNSTSKKTNYTNETNANDDNVNISNRKSATTLSSSATTTATVNSFITTMNVLKLCVRKMIVHATQKRIIFEKNVALVVCYLLLLSSLSSCDAYRHEGESKIIFPFFCIPFFSLLFRNLIQKENTLK